jgi:hypothetical protein
VIAVRRKIKRLARSDRTHLKIMEFGLSGYISLQSPDASNAAEAAMTLMSSK